MVKDPICGRDVASAAGAPAAEYKKRQYIFCSERCRTAFLARAERLRLHELWRAGAMLTKGGAVRWALA